MSYSGTFEGTYNILNKDIILTHGNAYSGHSYKYVDSDVNAGHVYYYWRADLDVFGEYTIHGPVKVITNLADRDLIR